MANSLFPEGYDEELLTDDEVAAELEEEEEVIGYKTGVYFSEELGDFARDGQNKLIKASGVESWYQWCVRCLATEKFMSDYYSEDFGIETIPALEAQTTELAETMLVTEITEGLLADPYGRTQSVDDITFVWDGPDSVHVTVEATGIDGATIDLEVDISAETR